LGHPPIVYPGFLLVRGNSNDRIDQEAGGYDLCPWRCSSSDGLASINAWIASSWL
jgi:hypothetical protein